MMLSVNYGFYWCIFMAMIIRIQKISAGKACYVVTGPCSSVGRVSAPGNGMSRVRSRAATYQSR